MLTKVEGLRAALHNLLAVIHRDGGHYTSDHGLAKSLEDAMGLSSERVHENERLRAENRGHLANNENLADACKQYERRAVTAEARIEAALVIPKDLRKEMGYAMWPGLTPDELLDEVEKRTVEALKGERS